MGRVEYLQTFGVILISAGVALALAVAAMGGGGTTIHSRAVLFVYPMLIIGLVLLVWSRVEGALESMVAVQTRMEAWA